MTAWSSNRLSLVRYNGKEPLFEQTGCGVMAFEMCGIDHQSVGLTRLACKRLKNPIEHAQFAPSDEATVKCLVRAVFLRCVLPLKSMFNT